jgi:hypothetical protein
MRLLHGQACLLAGICEQPLQWNAECETQDVTEPADHSRTSPVLSKLMMVTVASCDRQAQSHPEEGFVVRGCSRTKAGALAGSAVGVPGMGAAIGGVGGALAGYSIGHHLQNAQNEQVTALDY